MITLNKAPRTGVLTLKRAIYCISIGLLFPPLPAWSSEATLRVAFVYNFIKFITWPDSANTAFHLCALNVTSEAQNALAQLNGKVVNGQGANKQVIEVLYINEKQLLVSSITGCQMLYRPVHSTLMLPSPLPAGVVLVADEPEANDANVSIAIVRSKEGRMEFLVNKAAVDHAGVGVSSQLLKLAKNSKGTREND